MNVQCAKGNILFIILVAIALFGLLAFTITRTGGVGAGAGGQGRAQIAANEIVTYAQQISSAVDTIISRGALVTQVSFEAPGLAPYTHIPLAALDQNKVFSAQGGGLSYHPPKTEWLDPAYSADGLFGNWLFSGSTCVQNAGSGGVNCRLNARHTDLVAILPFIREDICRHINLVLHRQDIIPQNTLGDMWGIVSRTFRSTFATGGRIGSYFTPYADEGEADMAGCVQHMVAGYAGSYHFYRVLVAR